MYLRRFRIRADYVLVIDVDVVCAAADRQGFVFEVVTMFVVQGGCELPVQGETACADVAYLAKFDDIAFLLGDTQSLYVIFHHLSYYLLCFSFWLFIWSISQENSELNRNTQVGKIIYF